MTEIDTHGGPIPCMTYARFTEIMQDFVDGAHVTDGKEYAAAMKIALDLALHPNPRAWLQSIDSDVLRCPFCRMRVPTGITLKEAQKEATCGPLYTASYKRHTRYTCPGCSATLLAVPAKTHYQADDLRMIPSPGAGKGEIVLMSHVRPLGEFDGNAVFLEIDG
jgi:DNA-directed RNA polymerase subunit RPC12/RpoP